MRTALPVLTIYAFDSHSRILYLSIRMVISPGGLTKSKVVPFGRQMLLFISFSILFTFQRLSTFFSMYFYVHSISVYFNYEYLSVSCTMYVCT